MGFLSSITSLFSSNTSEATTTAEEAASVVYNGFIITPAPIAEGGQFRVAATITKGEDETLQTHQFIRSDLVGSRDECIEITIRKAKMTVDQLADSLFN